MTTYYSKDHEWIAVDGDSATIGITSYAQEQLGDVVYVELPEAGKALSQGDEAAVVESVKAASEVYAPIDGEEMFYEFLTWTKGEFRFEPDDDIDVERNFFKNATSLLLEGMRRLDEA